MRAIARGEVGEIECSQPECLRYVCVARGGDICLAGGGGVVVPGKFASKHGVCVRL